MADWLSQGGYTFPSSCLPQQRLVFVSAIRGKYLEAEGLGLGAELEEQMRRRYCDCVLDKLSLWGPVVARAMFGGYGLYREGLMFAIIVSDTLYFKIDECTRAFYEAAGSEPFSYSAKGKLVRLSYWQVPAEVLEDGEKLFAWSDQAYQVAQLARKKKR